MQGIDRQFMQLSQAFSYLISFVSIVMFTVAACVVLLNGRSSTERTLIGIGAVLQAISIAIGLGMSLLSRLGPLGNLGSTVIMFNALSYLLSFAGKALGLWGAVKLLHRAAQMELFMQDPDDDR